MTARKPRGVVARFEDGEKLVALAFDRCQRVHRGTVGCPCRPCELAVESAIRKALKGKRR